MLAAVATNSNVFSSLLTAAAPDITWSPKVEDVPVELLPSMPYVLVAFQVVGQLLIVSLYLATSVVLLPFAIHKPQVPAPAAIVAPVVLLPAILQFVPPVELKPPLLPVPEQVLPAFMRTAHAPALVVIWVFTELSAMSTWLDVRTTGEPWPIVIDGAASAPPQVPVITLIVTQNVICSCTVAVTEISAAVLRATPPSSTIPVDPPGT